MTAIHAVGAGAPTDPLDAAVAAVLNAPLPDIDTVDCVPGIGLVLGAFLRPHLHGLHPFLVECDLPGAVDVLDVLPDQATVLRLHRRNTMTEVLAAADGCLLVVRGWRRSGDVWASGADRDTVDRLVAGVRDKVSSPPVDGTVRVTFWHAGRHVVQRCRDLDVPTWAEIAHLYPEGARTAVERLLAYRPSSNLTGGRLVLWHGPPGTGKTTAVRALFDAWRDWTSAHVVSDAEQLLNNSDYLDRVLLESDDEDEDEDDDKTPSTRWRLVVIEDAQELLRRDARAQVSAGLGRLLNTADGLLGQGSKSLVLLTTNEPVDEMHPALVRPGRCLARIEFPPFGVGEAAELLGAKVSGAMTLAEIMERKGSLTRLEAVSEASRPGNYL